MQLINLQDINQISGGFSDFNSGDVYQPTIGDEELVAVIMGLGIVTGGVIGGVFSRQSCFGSMIIGAGNGLVASILTSIIAVTAKNTLMK